MSIWEYANPVKFLRVTERVLRISPCPVVVVRHPDHRYTLVE